MAHYQRWAAQHGLLTGPLPEPAALAALLAAPPEKRPAQEQSLVEPFGEQVLAWHGQGVEGQAIWQLLVAGVVATGYMNYRPNGCVHTVTTQNGATVVAIVWSRTEPV